MFRIVLAVAATAVMAEECANDDDVCLAQAATNMGGTHPKSKTPIIDVAQGFKTMCHERVQDLERRMHEAEPAQRKLMLEESRALTKVAEKMANNF